MPKPNFFIVGAPKAGTTSLAFWLSAHPQVYFSPNKEPHHFNSDDHRSYPDLAAYEALFEGATEDHLAIGEGSTWYLYSKEAAKNIEAYRHDARYIVCLRNPIEMAYSLHEQKIFLGYEHIHDFEQAWALNSARAEGKMTSTWCRNPRHLDYGSACLIGAQLQRLLATVQKDKVLTLLLDDVKENPRQQYLKVLSFLGLPDDGRDIFPLRNPAKARKSKGAHTLMQALVLIKETLGIRKSFGLLGGLEKKNVTYREREALSPSMRAVLENHFRDDISLLAELLDRDLSNWLNCHSEKKTEA
ncbi:MAG: sulfotransferase domain-containing protein [Methylococcaceae bacterium]|jgi:hypothetical protein